ncbi:MAG TPA: hypothetical protein VNQ15_14345 [Verrucomicrobiae bacterium]|nr:hypothetical protein [Verrucomicrobiae bacterium]
MRQSVLLVALGAITSLAAGLIARRAGAETRQLGRALLLALELIGTAALFLIANLALGVLIVLTIRSVSSHFVSIYVLNDVSLVGLSILQGVVFFCWGRAPAD